MLWRKLPEKHSPFGRQSGLHLPAAACRTGLSPHEAEVLAAALQPQRGLPNHGLLVQQWWWIGWQRSPEVASEKTMAQQKTTDATFRMTRRSEFLTV
jgi:hypothetical protein